MLKVIWAWSATAGIVASMLERPDLPALGWGVAGVFAVFGIVWTYYRLRVPAAA
ncbi:MAG: hypothetical protein OER21_15875 [Gemmatimonadota bacterium]|nr:hypothetical protein [Gemmatimonadota bacterium]